VTGDLGPRRLPVTVRPAPGESLRSLIEQTAHAHHVPVTAVLSAGGVRIGNTDSHALSLLENDPGAHATALATLLGLTPVTIRALTLHGGHDPSVVGWKKGRAVHRGWGSAASGRHCPRCLAANGGRWLLAWLSPWTQVCTRHDVFLTGRCPTCGQAPRSAHATRGHALPNGTRCTACNADLTTGTVHPAPTTSYAHLGQAYVDEIRRQPPNAVVNTPAGGQTLVSDQFQDLRLLARHVHALALPGAYDLTGTEADDWQVWTAHRDRPSTLTNGPTDAVYGSANRKTQTEMATYAASVGIAVTVLTATDMGQAASRLAPVLFSSYWGRSQPSPNRHTVRRAWANEDAAQWLLDAVAWPGSSQSSTDNR